jgi:uncharacterized protein
MKNKPLVILDTNIWISGLFWNGNEAKIIKLYTDFELFDVAFSEDTFQEIIHILQTKSKKFPKNIDIDSFSSALQTAGLFFSPSLLDDTSIIRDPKDLMLLELALSSKADYIVSGDNDLLVLKKYHETNIISPRKFLVLLAKEFF